MGRGNCCVHNDHEGLYYVDNDYIHIYRKNDSDFEDPNFALLGDLELSDISSSDWSFDELETQLNWEDIVECFRDSMSTLFPSFTRCSTWIDRGQKAVLENKLFYIAVEDNEWSMAFLLLQKEGSYGEDLSGLQKRHYERYLDGMKAALFEQFETLHTYGGPWTSGTIRRAS